MAEGPSELFERVIVQDFRGIHRLVIPLLHESLLEGHWTCIAGINGVGKTSVLQAIALVLLGQSYALELKTGFLQRMRRIENGSRRTAKLRLDTKREYWSLSIHDTPQLKSHGVGENKALRLPPLVLGYGATRNLSEFDDGRWVDASKQVRRVVTLFDPLTRVLSAQALIAGIEPNPGWTLFATLLERLPLPLRLLTPDGQRWLDESAITKGVLIGTDDGPLRPVDLPDGYRSTLAWLADLCLQHGEQFPEVTDLARMTGLVLIDEIDLHLHPQLQRELVPALRSALPGIQWVVTTHSPLVLTCFDRREIVALDRDAKGGIRELDRQIMAWSADDVYSWLMGTAPTGAAATGIIQERPDEAGALLRASPELNEEQARAVAKERHEQLMKVLGKS